MPMLVLRQIEINPPDVKVTGTGSVFTLLCRDDDTKPGGPLWSGRADVQDVKTVMLTSARLYYFA